MPVLLSWPRAEFPGVQHTALHEMDLLFSLDALGVKDYQKNEYALLQWGKIKSNWTSRRCVTCKP